MSVMPPTTAETWELRTALCPVCGGVLRYTEADGVFLSACDDCDHREREALV